MLRHSRFQAVVFLAAGALLGYAAASGKLNPFQRTEASPSSGTSSARKEGQQPSECSGCCPNGARQGQLLALADQKAKLAVTSAEEAGKKPNIVFIMGDDVGWFNIGAYHR